MPLHPPQHSRSTKQTPSRIPRPVLMPKSRLAEEARSTDSVKIRSEMRNPAPTSPTRIPKPHASFFRGARGIGISGGDFMSTSGDYIGKITYTGQTTINDHRERWLRWSTPNRYLTPAVTDTTNEMGQGNILQASACHESGYPDDRQVISISISIIALYLSFLGFPGTRTLWSSSAWCLILTSKPCLFVYLRVAIDPI